MRMRRRQLRPLDDFLLLIIEEPMLARLEAGDNGMPRGRRMPGCMLARRTVASADVPTLRTPAQMKPPAIRRGHTFHASITTRFRSGIDSTRELFHLRLPSLIFRAPARFCRCHPFLPPYELRPPY